MQSTEGVPGRMSSVEACRQLAAQIWRAERAHGSFEVFGLNTERAVRDRIHKIAIDLERLDDLDDALALQAIAIGWQKDDPLTILERTEHMLLTHRPGTLGSPQEILATSNRTTLLLVHLMILQCIAGRLGRWSVRSAEIPDARTARSLFRDLGEARYSQYRALLQTADELEHAGRHRDSALSLLDADRLVRTPACLLKAAGALTRAGDYISALWCVRTCLLEQPAAFESQNDSLRAHHLEGRLRAIIEGRSAVPLAPEEAALLIGDPKDPDDAASASPRLPLVSRTDWASEIGPSSRRVRLPPPWRSRRTATKPPTSRHRALLRSEHDSERTELQIDVPKAMASPSEMPRTLVSRPASNRPSNQAQEAELLELVSETFDVDLDLEDFSHAAPGSAEASTQEEWGPVAVDGARITTDPKVVQPHEEHTEIPPERPRARSVAEKEALENLAASLLSSERATELISAIVVIRAEDLPAQDDDVTNQVSARNMVTDRIRNRPREPTR